jgi:hypothetical protein
MARHGPAELIDEILSDGDHWSPSFARFPLAGTDGHVSIALSDADVWSDIFLDWPPRIDRSRSASSLRRAGYEILPIRSRPTFARRPLHGLRELDAEVRRLEAALSREPATFDSFPARTKRPGRPTGEGRFAAAAFDRMRNVHGWNLLAALVCRRAPAIFIHASAWSVAAWCMFVDDPPDRWIELDVQLFRKGTDEPHKAAELARLKRVCGDRLAPLGYRTDSVRGHNEPLVALFEKRVASLSAARRERSRLDHVLFSD